MANGPPVIFSQDLEQTPNPFGSALSAIGQGGMDIVQTLLARENIERECSRFSLTQRQQQMQLDAMMESVKQRERVTKAREKLGKMFQPPGGEAAPAVEGTPQNPFIRTPEDREAMRLMEVLPDLLEAYPQAADAVLGKFFTPRKMTPGDELRSVMGALGQGGGFGGGPPAGPGGPVPHGPPGFPAVPGQMPPGPMPDLPPGMEINIGGVKLKGGEASEGRTKRLEWAGTQGYDTANKQVRRYIASGDIEALPPGPTPKAFREAQSGNSLNAMRKAVADFQDFNLKVAKGEVKPSINDAKAMLATLTKSREALDMADLDPDTKAAASQNIDLAIAATAKIIAEATAGPEAVTGRRALLDQAKEAVRSYGSRKAAVAAVSQQPEEHRAMFRSAIDSVYPK